MLLRGGGTMAKKKLPKITKIGSKGGTKGQPPLLPGLGFEWQVVLADTITIAHVFVANPPTNLGVEKTFWYSMCGNDRKVYMHWCVNNKREGMRCHIENRNKMPCAVRAQTIP